MEADHPTWEMHRYMASFQFSPVSTWKVVTNDHRSES